MKTHFITFKGNSLALGLNWEQVKTKKRKEVLNSAKKLRLKNPYYIRVGRLVGLTDTFGKKKIISPVGLIDKILPSNTIGIFPVPSSTNELYYLLINYNQQFHPLSDFVGSKQAIKKLLKGLNTDLAVKYAPPEFEFEDAENISLLHVLPKSFKNGYLRPISLKKIVGWLIFIVIVVLIAGFVYHSWQNKIEQQQQIERERIAHLALEKKTHPKIQHPWSVLLLPNALANRCQTAWGDAPISINGWLFYQAECNDDSITYRYIRSNKITTNEDFNSPYLKSGHSVFTNDTVNVTIKLPTINDNSLFRDEALKTKNQTKQQLNNMLSPLKITPIFDQQFSPINAVNIHPNTFKFQSVFQPIDLLALFNDEIGIRFTKLIITLNSNDHKLAYTYQGNLYYDNK